MRAFITNLTTLRTTYSDPADQLKAQRLLLINLVWVVVLGGVTPVFIILAIGGYRDAASLYSFVSLGLALIVHYLIQHGRFQLASWLFIANITVLAFLSIFPEYRLDTPFVLMMTLPITAAGILLRRVELWGVVVLIIVVTTVGGLLQINAGMGPTPLGSTATSIRSTLVILVIIITLNALTLWAILNSSETALRQRYILTDLFDVVATMSQALVTLPASGATLNQIVEQLREKLNLYHVQIFIVNPATGQATLRASTGYLGRRLLEEDSLATPEDDSPINDALRRQDPLLILAATPDDQRSSFLPATQGEVLLPLRVKDFLPFGVLDLHSTENTTFTPAMLKALTIVANQLSIALHNHQQANDLHASLNERDRLLDQVEANRRELARINRQFIGTNWQTYIAERESAVPSFDWRHGAVLVSQTESEVLNQTLMHGQPQLQRGADNTDVLSVPIRLRDQVLGAIEFRRSNQDTPWSTAALELAEAIADRLALSLENARLFEQAQVTAQREQLVNQITSELQTNTNLETLIAQAAIQFQQALGATHTRVRLGLTDDDSSNNQA